jgi:pSer/pThr/pTyr-binding forkhead associated (FHA) protein
MQCQSCGLVNSSNSRFCRSCGRPLGAMTQVEASAQPFVLQDSARNRNSSQPLIVHIGRERSPNTAHQSFVIPTGMGQVSRSHALIHVLPHGGLQIENLSQVNGTSVNGRPVIQSMPVQLTDDVRLGSYRLQMSDIQPFINAAFVPRMQPLAQAPTSLRIIIGQFLRITNRHIRGI